ncbi:hypothetical protein BZG36_04874 [Bifiguratus adelaidae]|uniref:Uncharacterized protein n=1 Tax=Bifiguratus adelaidae TaxID=1938954 RepID=A0A261XUH6_9FUNG|nr:hypothetical protein BZG36_04874 [Bifiguratus adelaidae]
MSSNGTVSLPSTTPSISPSSAGYAIVIPTNVPLPTTATAPQPSSNSGLPQTTIVCDFRHLPGCVVFSLGLLLWSRHRRNNQLRIQFAESAKYVPPLHADLGSKGQGNVSEAVPIPNNKEKASPTDNIAQPPAPTTTGQAQYTPPFLSRSPILLHSLKRPIPATPNIGCHIPKRHPLPRTRHPIPCRPQPPTSLLFTFRCRIIPSSPETSQRHYRNLTNQPSFQAIVRFLNLQPSLMSRQLLPATPAALI